METDIKKFCDNLLSVMKECPIDDIFFLKMIQRSGGNISGRTYASRPMTIKEIKAVFKGLKKLGQVLAKKEEEWEKHGG